MNFRTLSNRELVSIAERDARHDTDPLFAALVQRVSRAPEEAPPRSPGYVNPAPLLAEVRGVR